MIINDQQALLVIVQNCNDESIKLDAAAHIVQQNGRGSDFCRNVITQLAFESGDSTIRDKAKTYKEKLWGPK